MNWTRAELRLLQMLNGVIALLFMLILTILLATACTQESSPTTPNANGDEITISITVNDTTISKTWDYGHINSIANQYGYEAAVGYVCDWARGWSSEGNQYDYDKGIWPIIPHQSIDITDIKVKFDYGNESETLIYDHELFICDLAGHSRKLAFSNMMDYIENEVSFKVLRKYLDISVYCQMFDY